MGINFYPCLKFYNENNTTGIT